MYNDDKKIKYRQKPKKRERKTFFQEEPLKKSQIVNRVEKVFSKVMWNEIFSSIGFITIGIMFYFYSDASTIFIGIVLGILFMIAGIEKIMNYFKKRVMPLFSFNLYFGIISLILGIITLLNPFFFTQVATMMIGLWLIYNTFVKADLAFRLKKINEQSWLFLLISALLSLFMGIILIINPFNNLILTQIIGSFLILYGVLNATDAFLMKKRASAFLAKL